MRSDTCDTFGGQSGSSLYLYSGGKRTIYGVVSGSGVRSGKRWNIQDRVTSAEFKLLCSYVAKGEASICSSAHEYLNEEVVAFGADDIDAIIGASAVGGGASAGGIGTTLLWTLLALAAAVLMVAVYLVYRHCVVGRNVKKSIRSTNNAAEYQTFIE